MDLGPQPINPLTQSFWPNGPGRPQPINPSHTSAAICLFALHCSITQYLWALATRSKLLILHFTTHSTFSKLKTHPHTHTQSTLSKLTQKLHLTTVPSHVILVVSYGMFGIVYLTANQGWHVETALYVVVQIITTIGFGDITVTKEEEARNSFV